MTDKQSSCPATREAVEELGDDCPLCGFPVEAHPSEAEPLERHPLTHQNAGAWCTECGAPSWFVYPGAVEPDLVGWPAKGPTVCKNRRACEMRQELVQP